ncbi:hypothetical protein [Pedobacter jeongneungensis]|uniref:hypothetical protein n=1 Tax=Pedobacter jeongneungensis TaxID=947309 RepID=UPI000469943A|nr:hypothetical protein [Pedobacter jeongneungensis]
MKRLTIKIDNENVYLSPNTTIPLIQTNFPYRHCKLRSHRDVFWEVELLGYMEDSRCWHIQVIGYSSIDISSFERQKSTREISKIVFERFDWNRLERLLSSYHKMGMQDMLYNLYPGRHDFPDSESSFFKGASRQSFTDNGEHLSKENDMSFGHLPQIKEHQITFSVDFKDAQFSDGLVKFSKKTKEISQSLNFQIVNNHLRAEFDHIKSWFGKWFKTKKFIVNAVIIQTDGKVTGLSAESAEISMINQELIDRVREQRTVALTKSLGGPERDRSLFTAMEVFNETGDAAGNVFLQQEEDILQLLIKKTETRNHKQLDYLSGVRQSKDVKLRFTLAPSFGFVFFVRGGFNNHFVWELLNTNATYIWSFDSKEGSTEQQLKEVEGAIAFIKQNGREPYKRKYRQENKMTGFSFSSIEHDGVSSETEEGFLKWKDKVELNTI